jgi:hypothetical protein
VRPGLLMGDRSPSGMLSALHGGALLRIILVGSWIECVIGNAKRIGLQRLAMRPVDRPNLLPWNLPASEESPDRGGRDLEIFRDLGRGQ